MSEVKKATDKQMYYLNNALRYGAIDIETYNKDTLSSKIAYEVIGKALNTKVEVDLSNHYCNFMNMSTRNLNDTRGNEWDLHNCMFN